MSRVGLGTPKEETRALLALARACLAAHVSLWQVSATVERLGAASRALEGDFDATTPWEAEVRAAARALDPGRRRKAADQLEREFEEWRARGLELTTVLDEETYPLNLRFVYDRPPFLFYRGALRPDDALALAVVGTRDSTDEGRRRARRMAALLVAEGVTVLSGLARGIDTEAHAASMAEGGRTIAVLGHGFDHMYPAENADLANRIAAHGAVVSQFFPSTPPSRRTFPLRNTVTSGLGQGTCVVEASRTSGARLQARLALEHGKRAFLLRSLVAEQEWARDFARRDGAVVIDDVAEVLAHLRRPRDLEVEWQREGESIRRRNAEPPPVARRRLASVGLVDQEQLSL